VQAGSGHPGGHSPSLADVSHVGYTGPAPDSNATTFGYGWTCAVRTATGYDPCTPGLELIRSKTLNVRTAKIRPNASFSTVELRFWWQLSFYCSNKWNILSRPLLGSKRPQWPHLRHLWPKKKVGQNLMASKLVGSPA